MDTSATNADAKKHPTHGWMRCNMLDQDLAWELLAIVSLPKAERIECRCKTCPKTIYAEVHIIRWSDGRIEPWGSGCYRRELGCTPRGRDMEPHYPAGWGDGLPPDVRQLIGTRTDLFIAELEKRLQEQREQERKAKAAAEEQRRQHLLMLEGQRKAREQREREEREAHEKAQEAARVEAEKWRQTEEEFKRDAQPEPQPQAASHGGRYDVNSFDADGDQAELVCELCGRRTRKWWMTEMTAEGRKCRCKACASEGRWGQEKR
jgi:hypothetical protein